MMPKFNCAICPRLIDVRSWANVVLDEWAIDALNQSNAGANPKLDHVNNMLLDQRRNTELDLGANMQLLPVDNRVQVE